VGAKKKKVVREQCPGSSQEPTKSRDGFGWCGTCGTWKRLLQSGRSRMRTHFYEVEA
jgi:hypothetical protein